MYHTHEFRYAFKEKYLNENPCSTTQLKYDNTIFEYYSVCPYPAQCFSLPWNKQLSEFCGNHFFALFIMLSYMPVSLNNIFISFIIIYYNNIFISFNIVINFNFV